MKNPIQNLIQYLWETQTVRGKMHVKQLERRTHYRESPKPEVNNLLTAMENANYRFTGGDETGAVRILKYVTVDKEVDIHIHQNNGDLYGAFVRINSSDVNEIITRLTTDDKRWLQIENTLDSLASELDGQIPPLAQRENTPLDTHERFLLHVQTMLRKMVNQIRTMRS